VAASDRAWRIGELASAAGLTVRTLHYYDEIGLLSPSVRSNAGHRVYIDGDVQRLYRVCMLRRLGLSLTQVGSALDDEPWDLTGALTTQLTALDARLDAEHRLRARIAGLLADPGAAGGELSVDLLEVMEDMTAIDSGVQRRISILVYSDLEAPEFSLASPRTLGAATGMVAILVEDVDAHYRRAVDEGAVIRYAPIDQPYGYREYSAVDCEGHLWSFMKALI
jgi:DNA-binding transcriptional MerR regulator